MGFPPRLKVQRVAQSSNISSSCTSSPWDIERLLCKSELGCSDKIGSHKKRFAANLTNYT